MEEYWFLAPMSRLAISSALLHGPSNFAEENFFVQKGDRVTRLDPISGTEFDHFWNWFGKNKFPGALQLLK